MSNNNNSNRQNQGNNGGYNRDMYASENLIQELDNISISMNRIGNLFTIETYALEDQIEQLIDRLGIKEIDSVMVYPQTDRQGRLQNIICRAYFNTEGVTNGNISKIGGGKKNNGTASTIAELAGIPISGNGGFYTSENFKQTIAALAITGNDNKLKISALPERPSIAVIDMDFAAVIGLAMHVEASSPFAINLIHAKALDGAPGKYQNYLLTLAKVIDNQSRKGKRKSFDYRSVNARAVNQRFGNQKDDQRNFG